ncbi:hypothetical protein IAT38_000268 [Cryptococcus sp. DSM 104549]
MDSLTGVPYHPHPTHNNDPPGSTSDGYFALMLTAIRLHQPPLARRVLQRRLPSSAVTPPSPSVFGLSSPFIGSSVPWPARVYHRLYAHSPDDLNLQGFWANGTTFFWRSPARFREPAEWQAELALIAKQTAELDALEAYGWELRNRGTETDQTMELFDAFRSDMDAPESLSWPAIFAGFVSACFTQVAGASYFLLRTADAAVGLPLEFFEWWTPARDVLKYDGDGLNRREWMATQAVNEAWAVVCKRLPTPETPHSFTLVFWLLVQYFSSLSCSHATLVALGLVLLVFQNMRGVIAGLAGLMVPQRFVDSAIFEISQDIPLSGADLSNLAPAELFTTVYVFLALLPTAIATIVDAPLESRTEWHLVRAALTKAIGPQSGKLDATGTLAGILQCAKTAYQRSWEWMWATSWTYDAGKGSLVVVSGSADSDPNITGVLTSRGSSGNHTGFGMYSLESAVDRFHEDSEIALLTSNCGTIDLEINKNTVTGGHEAARADSEEEGGRDGAARSATIKPSTYDTDCCMHANGQHQVVVDDEGVAVQELAVEGASADFTGPLHAVVGDSTTESELDDGGRPAGIEVVSGELDSAAGVKGSSATMSSNDLNEHKLALPATEPSISGNTPTRLDIAPRPVVVDDKGVAPEPTAEIVLLEKAESIISVVEVAPPTSELETDSKPASVEAAVPDELVPPVRTAKGHFTNDIKDIIHEPTTHKAEPSTVMGCISKRTIEQSEVVIDDHSAAPPELTEDTTHTLMTKPEEKIISALPATMLERGATPSELEVPAAKGHELTARINYEHAYEDIKIIQHKDNQLVSATDRIVQAPDHEAKVLCQTESMGNGPNAVIEDPSLEDLPSLSIDKAAISTDSGTSTADASTPSILTLSPEEQKEAREREAKHLLNQKKKLKKRSKVKELKAEAAAAAAAGTPWTTLFVNRAEPSTNIKPIASTTGGKLEVCAGVEEGDAGHCVVTTECPEATSQSTGAKSQASVSQPTAYSSKATLDTKPMPETDDISASATVDRQAAERKAHQRELKLKKKKQAREKEKLLKAEAAVHAAAMAAALEGQRMAQDEADEVAHGRKPEDMLTGVERPRSATVRSKIKRSDNNDSDTIVSAQTPSEGMLAAGTLSERLTDTPSLPLNAPAAALSSSSGHFSSSFAQELEEIEAAIALEAQSAQSAQESVSGITQVSAASASSSTTVPTAPIPSTAPSLPASPKSTAKKYASARTMWPRYRDINSPEAVAGMKEYLHKRNLDDMARKVKEALMKDALHSDGAPDLESDARGSNTHELACEKDAFDALLTLHTPAASSPIPAPVDRAAPLYTGPHSSPNAKPTATNAFTFSFTIRPKQSEKELPEEKVERRPVRGLPVRGTKGELNKDKPVEDFAASRVKLEVSKAEAEYGQAQTNTVPASVTAGVVQASMVLSERDVQADEKAPSGGALFSILPTSRSMPTHNLNASRAPKALAAYPRESDAKHKRNVAAQDKENARVPRLGRSPFSRGGKSSLGSVSAGAGAVPVNVNGVSSGEPEQVVLVGQKTMGVAKSSGKAGRVHHPYARR